MQKLNNPSSKRKSSVTNCVYPNKEKFQPRRHRRRRKTNVMQCCQPASHPARWCGVVRKSQFQLQIKYYKAETDDVKADRRN